MAQTDGRVLSDVHVHMGGQPVHKDGADLTESRFLFRVPKSQLSNVKSSSLKTEKCAGPKSASFESESHPSVGHTGHTETSDAHDDSLHDSDGDIIVRRRTAEEELVISIVHAMATDLHCVGQQVWLGALLLCDFLLHYSSLLVDKVVVDLGAGVGLTSIVAGFHASIVFCTDRGYDVLNLADHNIERNSALLQDGDVRVRELDWNAAEVLSLKSEGSSKHIKHHSMSEKDLETLRSCSIIIAAEVVYDQSLTDAYFCLLYHLLLEPPSKTVYMTVEKRQVFSMADLDVVSPAYEHFRENMQDLSSVDEGPVRFLCSQVEISFPKYFHYQRIKELLVLSAQRFKAY